MKKIMILGASDLQVPAIKEAKKMGLEVIAVDMDENAIGFKYSDVNLVVSSTDTEKVLKAAEKYSVDGIIAVATDKPVKTVATVCEKLGLTGVSKFTADATTNKYLMRKQLYKNNIEVPQFFKASTINEFFSIVNIFKDINKKCIIKPVDNSGSRGVQLIESYDEQKLINYYDYCVNNSFSNDIIVEEFMEGPEVSVETFTIDGKCEVIQITDKLTSGSPNFIELGHSQPSVLSEEIKELIKNLTIRANKALGIHQGPSHTEVIVTKDGPKIVEIGARLGGDNITSHLVPLSTGINLTKACIQLAVGEKPFFKKSTNKASAISYIKCGDGIIKNIEGIEDAKNICGVQQVKILKNVGDKVHTIHSSSDRVGYVIVQSEKVEDAIEISNEALNSIQITLSNGGQ